MLLLDRKEGDAGYRELQEITRAGQRGGELTQQLLTFSRKVESKKRPIDLNHEVSQTVKLLSRTIPRMVKIELNLTGDLKVVNTDPLQIEQAVMNLALNAKDAMPEGGKLSLKTRNVVLDEEDTHTLPGVEPGEYVMLSISDTGYGMEKRPLSTSLNHFLPPKNPGTEQALAWPLFMGQ